MALLTSVLLLPKMLRLNDFFISLKFLIFHFVFLCFLAAQTDTSSYKVSEMDEVTKAVEKAKKDWEETYGKTLDDVKAIEDYGKSADQKNSLPRLNGLAQDGLALLSSLQFKLDLLAPQLPSDEDIQSADNTLQSWKNQIQRYVMHLPIWLLRKSNE